MHETKLFLPESACAYEHYDPETLIPTNDSTYIRLMELGWKTSEFSNRTVLDIGANTGMLSIYALQLGASRVHSIDVQQPLVDFFSTVVTRHRLPITVEQRNFDQLDPCSHAADIVCLMEVLHWLVDQGMTVEDSVARVAALTRETLYLETPWDVREPSISSKGIVREDQYNMELLFRELSHHFRDVRIVCFTTYFGMMKDSKRVLIRASGRREMGLPLVLMRGANLVDISMVRGPNQVELVTTPQGLKVIKRLPSESVLSRLDEETVEALCAHLAALPSSVLVSPELLGENFRFVDFDQRTYMLFPFVGRLANYFPERRPPEDVNEPLAIAVALRNNLRFVPRVLVEKIHAACGPISVVHIDCVAGKPAAAVTRSNVGELCRQAALRIVNYDRSREDTLCHSDMQGGNMVITYSGKARIVDLDLIRTGTPYSDLLCCAIYSGASINALQSAIELLANQEERPLEQFDIDFSVVQTVGWLEARSACKPQISKQELYRYLTGLRTVMQIMESLPASLPH